jgi:hypothetical protein
VDASKIAMMNMDNSTTTRKDAVRVKWVIEETCISRGFSRAMPEDTDVCPVHVASILVAPV